MCHQTICYHHFIEIFFVFLFLIDIILVQYCEIHLTFRSGTLFVVLDIDNEILEWLDSLGTKQFADCSWLMILPLNVSKIQMSVLSNPFNDSEKLAINQMTLPFKNMTSEFCYFSINSCFVNSFCLLPNYLRYMNTLLFNRHFFKLKNLYIGDPARSAIPETRKNYNSKY